MNQIQNKYLVNRILTIALRAENDIFVTYSPHVKSIDVSYYDGKWEAENPTPTWRETVYLDHEDATHDLVSLIIRLEKGGDECDEIMARFDKLMASLKA